MVMVMNLLQIFPFFQSLGKQTNTHMQVCTGKRVYI